MAKYSYSNARERAEKHTSGFDSTSIKLPEGVKLFKPKKAGVYKIDIIPFVAGKGNPYADEGILHYERTFHVHPRVGGQDGDTYVCPRETVGAKCPICEFQKQLMRDGGADEKLVKSLYPKERQLFQLIDLAEPEKGIQIWDVSYHLFGKFLDARIKNSDEDDKYDRFYRLVGGKTLKLGFEEETFNKQTFLKVSTIDFKDRAEDYGEDMLEKGYCLDELLKIPTYNELKAALEGGGSAKDDGDDEPKKRRSDDDDDAPKKRPAASDDDDAPAPKKKPAPADDDDDAPAPKKRPADDDDDAPAPKKKPAADDDDAPAPKKKPAASDDDDDAPAPKKKPAADDDDDWEKEREKPKKKPADDDDDAPAPKKKPAADDDDDAPAPKKKPAASDDDDEAPKKKRPADDDDDAPAPKKANKPKDDDWD